MKNFEKFYDKNPEKEWTRLEKHPLEFEMTKKLLDKFITKPFKILNIGGGPGKYAFYLKEKGHAVHLIDLSNENIKFAQIKSKELNIDLDEYRRGNVLNLKHYKKETFDAVLCLGPLYHLIKKTDQQKALSECLRVLKSKGLIYISFITKFAQPLSLIQNEPEKITEWKSYFEKVIETGFNAGDIDKGFTDSCFFSPDEIEELMKKFPIKKLTLFGIEGLFAQNEYQLKNMDKKVFDEWIDLSLKYASHPSILGACQHLMYIGEKK